MHNMWKKFQKFLNLFKRKKYTIDSLVRDCKGNLASLSFDIGKAVRYEKDDIGESDFTNPQKVLDRGHGDCDDYAYIWLKCLDQLGYKTHIYTCINDTIQGKNHAIVIFLNKGYWCYTSNDEYIKTNFGLTDDRNSFLKFAYPDAERYEIVV